MKIEWSPNALEREATIDAWWRENRPDAPDLFTRELLGAIEQIASFPEVPPVCAHVDGRPVRSVLLPKTRQHLYYSVHRDRDALWIHTIWGTRRDEPPPL